MNNIAISYLYRDAGNYKQHNTEVFTNNTCLSIDDIRQRIKALLIDGEWFDANEWGFKDLHFDDWDIDLDLLWHEIGEIVETDGAATKADIAAFLLDIESGY